MKALTAIAFLWICLFAYFFWPIVAPHWMRRSVSERLLDRLLEEWERDYEREDDEAPRFDGRPW